MRATANELPLINGNSDSKPPERRKHAGQGLVEMALITPILALMMLGAVDFGRVLSASIQVSDAARAGAYFGARSSTNANDKTAIETAATDDSGEIFGTEPDVVSDTGTDSEGFEYVEVTVTYSFSPIVPYPGIPGSTDLSETVRMRVIGS